MAKPDRERVQHAQFVGEAAGLRDAVMLADPEKVQLSRDELLQLWARIDGLIGLVEGSLIGGHTRSRYGPARRLRR